MAAVVSTPEWEFNVTRPDGRSRSGFRTRTNRINTFGSPERPVAGNTRADIRAAFNWALDWADREIAELLLMSAFDIDPYGGLDLDYSDAKTPAQEAISWANDFIEDGRPVVRPEILQELNELDPTHHLLVGSFGAEAAGKKNLGRARTAKEAAVFADELMMESTEIESYDELRKLQELAAKKNPESLVAQCQANWDHYLARPGKKRLKAVLEHLETMKASKSAKVRAERRRCLRVANSEAKEVGV
jgi:hypothetical protein